MKTWIKRIAYLVLFLFVFINVITAFHAYKFTHFFPGDQVTKKRPEDMNALDKTKAVLFGIDYVKSTPKVLPRVPYNTFQTKTSDGVTLEGWMIPAKNAKGTIIMFHGHGSNRSGILNEAMEFNKLGYSICMVDFRAHGNSEGTVCTIGDKEIADVKAAYDYAIAKSNKPIILYGISLGASTIIKAMHDYPEMKVEKAILEMPFGSLYEAVKGRLRIMHVPEQPFATLLTFWGGLQQQFWAFGLNPQDYARAVKVPILLQWGKHDARVTETETKAILANLNTQQKRLVVYENSGHQSLLSNEPAKWNANVKEFLEQ
jgi:alpha-beta hydrolase superfamily lysophospholipase